MREWETQKKWADRFMPAVKEACGRVFIKVPHISEDQMHNTDLIVLTLDAIRIGCRIRKSHYYGRWPNEFTIRAGLPSGHKTELEKIMKEKWGDFLFYGFSHRNEIDIEFWRMIDLSLFRDWWWEKRKECSPGEKKNNGDGTWFYAFDVTRMPENVVYSDSDILLGEVPF